MKQSVLAFIGAACTSVAVSAAPPMPVGDLHIQLLDPLQVQLDWSPVELDTQGQPLACVYYDIHRGSTPDFIPGDDSRIASTFATQYMDSLAGDLGIYRVQVRSCDMSNAPEMVLIPAGQFVMGQAGVNTPEHEVTLTHDFLLGRTEVTNRQYRDAVQWALEQGLVTADVNTVMAHGVELLDLDDPDCQIEFDGVHFNLEPVHAGSYVGESSADHPVSELSWYGAASYCDWLSLMAGLPAYYNGQWSQSPGPDNPYTAIGYRLPTEAEWEYAAQHDDERTYPWGNAAPSCALVNFFDTGSNAWCVGGTSPVGSFPAGASSQGVQDMAGNLWEWVNDWHAGYGANPQSNPTGPAGGSSRVIRGGSWTDVDSYLTCAYRDIDDPSLSWSLYGFRICRSAPDNPIP